MKRSKVVCASNARMRNIARASWLAVRPRALAWAVSPPTANKCRRSVGEVDVFGCKLASTAARAWAQISHIGPGDFGPGDFGPGDFGPGDFECLECNRDDRCGRPRSRRRRPLLGRIWSKVTARTALRGLVCRRTGRRLGVALQSRDETCAWALTSAQQTTEGISARPDPISFDHDPRSRFSRETSRAIAEGIERASRGHREGIERASRGRREGGEQERSTRLGSPVHATGEGATERKELRGGW
jgi:hypothetical protein